MPERSLESAAESLARLASKCNRDVLRLLNLLLVFAAFSLARPSLMVQNLATRSLIDLASKFDTLPGFGSVRSRRVSLTTTTTLSIL